MMIELRNVLKTKMDARKAFVDGFGERGMSPEDQATFEGMSAEIKALRAALAARDEVEDDDKVDDKVDEVDADLENDDDTNERSSKPKTDFRHLDFKVSSSKTRKDSEVYCVTRALALAASGKMVTGIEGEHSQEIARYRGAPKGNLYIPWDFKMRGRHKMKRRDLTTTSGTGAIGVTVEPTFIELLRNRMVFDEVNGTIMTDLKGKFALPRQNAASSYYFVGEGSSVTGSNPTLDQVNFVPKTMGIQVNTSRKMMFESSIDAMTFVENDILKSFAVGLDTTILAGNGSGATPTGILYQSGVSSITLGSDIGSGAGMSYADTVLFETVVANANADRGSLNWVTTPGVRGKLKSTPKINTGQVYPEFVWASDNTVNGYPAHVTNEMPTGLTKGSGSNLHSAIFGNWEDAVLALWSGIDVLVNPYLNASQGSVQINAFQEVDVQLRHPQSFAISTAVSAT